MDSRRRRVDSAPATERERYQLRSRTKTASSITTQGSALELNKAVARSGSDDVVTSRGGEGGAGRGRGSSSAQVSGFAPTAEQLEGQRLAYLAAVRTNDTDSTLPIIQSSSFRFDPNTKPGDDDPQPELEHPAGIPHTCEASTTHESARERTTSSTSLSTKRPGRFENASRVQLSPKRSRTQLLSTSGLETALRHTSEPSHVGKPIFSTPETAKDTSSSQNSGRVADPSWIVANLPGRTFEDPLGDILNRIIPKLGERYLGDLERAANAFKVQEKSAGLRTGLPAELQRCLTAERSPSQHPMWRKGSRYWVQGLCEEVESYLEPSAQSSPFVYKSWKNATLLEKYRILHPRKLDAALQCSTAASPSWANQLVILEFTTAAVSLESVFSTTPGNKFQQHITDMADVFVEQPWRQYVVGIAVFDKEAWLLLLDHESLSIANIDNLRNPRGVLSLGVVLSLLRNASVFELGFSPLFDFHFVTSPGDPAIPPKWQQNEASCVGGDLVPTGIHMPPEARASDSTTVSSESDNALLCKLQGRSLSYFTRSPFSRCTEIFEVLVPVTGERGPSIDADTAGHVHLLKLAWVDDGRKAGESNALRAFTADVAIKISDGTADFLPSYKRSAVLERPSICRNEPRIPLGGNASVYAPRRHPELLLTSTRSGGQPLHKLKTPRLMLQVFVALVKAIRTVGDFGWIHGDISSGNVLGTDAAKLIWIDWETAKRWSTEAHSKERSGTRDTMSIDALMMDSENPHLHQPLHELESAVYLLVKSVILWLLRGAGKGTDAFTELKDLRLKLKFDDPRASIDSIILVREVMWLETGSARRTLLRQVKRHGRQFVTVIDQVLSLPQLRGTTSVDERNFTAACDDLEGVLQQALASPDFLEASQI